MEWYYLAALAAFFVSFVPILRKNVLIKEHATEYSTTVYLFVSLMLLPSVIKIDWNAGLATWLLMYLKSALITAAIIFSNKAARHMEVSSVEPLRNFSVIFVLMMSFIFLGERINGIQGIGIILILLGSYILEVKKASLKFSSAGKKWLLYLMLAMFLGSISAVLDKIILKETSVYTLLIVPTLFLTIHLLLIQFFVYKGSKDIMFSIKFAGFSILAIAGLTIASEVSYLFAVATPVSLLSLIMTLRRLTTLISTFVGGELFHEHNLFQKITAAIIMIAGTYLVVV